MRFPGSLLLALALPAAAMAQRAPADSVLWIRGCYAIVFMPPDSAVRYSNAFGPDLPLHFRLDSGTVDNPFTSRLMRVVPARVTGALGGWRFFAPDLVQLVWTSGFVSAWITLRFAGDTIRGTAHYLTDVIPPAPIPPVPVAAVRESCLSNGSL